MWGAMWGAPTILRVAVRMFSSPCVTLICMTGSQVLDQRSGMLTFRSPALHDTAIACFP
jgi:hypothetical protein